MLSSIDYTGQLFISLTAEPRLLPDVGRLKDLIVETFQEMRKRLPKIATGFEHRASSSGNILLNSCGLRLPASLVLSNARG